MRIASIVDISLVDVPGIPVTVLFTGGCNFDCPYCHNADLIPMSSGVEMDIPEIIAKSRGHLTDGFCITGGEPTVHKDLPDLLRALKNLDNNYINLNTQGSIPSVLKQSLPFLNSIWMDIKCNPERYADVTRAGSDLWQNVRQSIEMTLDSDTEFWPRTTYAAGLVDRDDIVAIVDVLGQIGFRGKYLIQNYIMSAGVREEDAAGLKSPGREEMDALRELGTSDIEIVIEWNDVVGA